LKGWRTGDRIVNVLSNLELALFFNLEWDPKVSDYRDQFPLEMEGLANTQEIADMLGYKHPQGRDKKTKTLQPIPMSTDFLVTHHDGSEVAYAVKPAVEVNLEDTDRPRHVERNWEKLEIEKKYFALRRIDWELVTENQINFILARNVETVHQEWWTDSLYPYTEADVERVNEFLFSLVCSETHPLKEIARECDDALKLEPGAAQQMAHHLIARRRWPVDFSVPYELGGILRLQKAEVASC